MIDHRRRTVVWVLAAALLGLPPGVCPAQDKWDPAGKKSKEGAPLGAKDKSSGGKDGSTPALTMAARKLYRFKGEKKTNTAGGQPMTLMVEEVFTGKAETLTVPDEDPATREYTPVADVAATVAELEPGMVVEVETDKQKGRNVVTRLAKADYKPGEETPNGFVFVSQDAEKKGGVETVSVTLSKFGREVKVGVPMVKDDDAGRDAKWEPDPKIDGVVRRLQSGAVVEALVKPGRQPMLTEIYEMRPPERGKFIGFKETKFNEWPAAGFEIAAGDGTTITFTLEGVEQTRNGQTVYTPSPQQLAAVRKLKKDAEVEVRYRLDGRNWMLRSLTPLAANAKPAAEKAPAKSGKAPGEMKDDGKAEPEMKDGADKPPAGDEGKDDTDKSKPAKT